MRRLIAKWILGLPLSRTFKNGEWKDWSIRETFNVNLNDHYSSLQLKIRELEKKDCVSPSELAPLGEDIFRQDQLIKQLFDKNHELEEQYKHLEKLFSEQQAHIAPKPKAKAKAKGRRHAPR